MFGELDAFDPVVEKLARGVRHINIHPRTVAATNEVLPRTEARIEIDGSGWFILRLDGVMSLDEIYEHDDDGVLQILSDFCAIAVNYLEGAGTINDRVARRGAQYVSIALNAGDDQYLLEGRLPKPEVAP
ncbi:hypothetical protein [Aeromicrobium sp.]|uniref:hypothetical protein n=1 Tax=Aeromicrobium sp. TaxID=1871063 RepID=UPI0019AF0C19|nr:hypothetical protein [Aeromicrobium sp.]MBC7632600.1 hypothetical protein [Aeromicrobium sp.]